jgi:hypothetical protein
VLLIAPPVPLVLEPAAAVAPPPVPGLPPDPASPAGSSGASLGLEEPHPKLARKRTRQIEPRARETPSMKDLASGDERDLRNVGTSLPRTRSGRVEL